MGRACCAYGEEERHIRTLSVLLFFKYLLRTVLVTRKIGRNLANFTVSPCILFHNVSLVPTYALVFKLY